MNDQKDFAQALIDVVDGMDAYDLRYFSGLPIERCEEIVKMVSEAINN